jgi:hypothetical protein
VQQPAVAAEGQGSAAEGQAATAPEAGAAAGDKRSAQQAALEAAREKSKKAKANQPQGWFELKNNTNV